MVFEDFIDALQDAGWRDTCDAQHAGALALWQKIFNDKSTKENKKTKNKKKDTVHHDSGRSMNMPISGRHSICSCGTSFQDRNERDAHRYTKNIEAVTCKNCLRIYHNKKEIFIKNSV